MGSIAKQKEDTAARWLGRRQGQYSTATTYVSLRGDATDARDEARTDGRDARDSVICTSHDGSNCTPRWDGARLVRTRLTVRVSAEEFL